jgi:hypothetical protein
MLDIKENVEHYYCRPRLNGGLVWRREVERLSLLRVRRIRTG